MHQDTTQDDEAISPPPCFAPTRLPEPCLSTRGPFGAQQPGPFGVPALRVALQPRSSHRRTRPLAAPALLLPGGTAQDCRLSQSCLGKPIWKTATKQALCVFPVHWPVRSQQRWLRVPGRGTWWCSIFPSRGTCSRDASSACHHAGWQPRALPAAPCNFPRLLAATGTRSAPCQCAGISAPSKVIY